MDAKDFKILIADDSILARKKLKACLSDLGYTNIIEAKDGVDAVEAFKAEHPNLIFMDIVMPNQYGIDALKEIMAISPDAIVVMISSTGTQKNITDSIKAGADEFILKPFTRGNVEAILHKFNR